MVEQAFPQEDGTVVRRVFPGEGEAPIDTVFDTDEMLVIARAQEQRAQRFEKFKHPFHAIREKVFGALDTAERVRVEQLTKETGSGMLLKNTIEGWRQTEEAYRA